MKQAEITVRSYRYEYGSRTLDHVESANLK